MGGGSHRREIMAERRATLRRRPGIVYTVLPLFTQCRALISAGIDKWILVILRSIYGVPINSASNDSTTRKWRVHCCPSATEMPVNGLDRCRERRLERIHGLFTRPLLPCAVCSIDPRLESSSLINRHTWKISFSVFLSPFFSRINLKTSFRIRH